MLWCESAACGMSVDGLNDHFPFKVRECKETAKQKMK